MALTLPLPGGVITQRFGPSPMRVQPSMFLRYTEKAYWNKFPGWTEFSEDVHAGVDFAGMPAGSPLVAPEAATIVRAEYDRYNGGGWVLEGEIRPGVRWSLNHCQALGKGVGAHVDKGERVATVGATGTIYNYATGQFERSTYGVHCHTLLTVREEGPDGITRTMLHDFLDFVTGGARAGSPLVRPIPTTWPTVIVNVGVNIRGTADLDVGATNIRYVTRSTGIYRYPLLAGAKPVFRAGSAFTFLGTTTNDDGTWGKLRTFTGERLYVMRGLYRAA